MAIFEFFLTRVTSNSAFIPGSSWHGKTFLASIGANSVVAKYLKSAIFFKLNVQEKNIFAQSSIFPCLDKPDISVSFFREPYYDKHPYFKFAYASYLLIPRRTPLPSPPPNTPLWFLQCLNLYLSDFSRLFSTWHGFTCLPPRF